MNLLNKLTIKSLKLNKKRTIVTIIGIILSTALIAAVSSLVVSARVSFIDYEKKENGDYHYVFHNVKKDDIKYFTNNRMIEKTYYTAGLGYAKVETQNEYKPYLFVKGYSDEALNSKKDILIEGRLPENDSEIAISSHIKNNGRLYYKVGDTLKLDIGKRYSGESILNQYNPYIPSEETFTPSYTKEYKIVGIIERLPYSEESFDAPGYTVITKLDDTLDEVDLHIRLSKEGLKNKVSIISSLLGIKENTYNLFIGGTNKDVSEEEYKTAEEDFENAKYSVEANTYLIKLESSLLEDESIKALAFVALIVIAIIIVTSIFCIKNSFDISITEKTRQYGMLSSIGATKKQIKKNVYFEALSLGIIGIPLGILCGLLASYVLLLITNVLLKDNLNLSLNFSFSILAILLSVILASITIYFSAMKSAKKASLTSPIEAIRNNNDIKIKKNHFKTPKIVKKLFGIGGDVSYKNLKRNKKKYRTTIVSIVVCVTIFIALSTFINLAFKVINLMVSSQNYNISLYYKDSEDDSVDEEKTMNEIINMDNILDYSITINNDSFYIVNPPLSTLYKEVSDSSNDTDNFYIPVRALGEHQYKEYIKELGLDYDYIKDKAILINYFVGSYYDEETEKNKRSEIEIFNYEKDDTINGYIENYDENNKNLVNLKIGAITNIKPLGDYGSSGHIIVSDEYFANNFASLNEKNNKKILYIDSKNPDELQNDIEELISNDKEKFSLYNINEEVKTMKSLFTLIGIFLYGFVTVIALIGITNIFNTITTSMNLRRREFAILKCIGMTKKEFNKMIRLESFMYGMKSLIIGIPLGLLLSILIHKALVNGEFVINFTPPYLAIALVIVFVFALIILIMKYSLSKINKQNIIETIRNENI